jgi:hypothetical protein
VTHSNILSDAEWTEMDSIRRAIKDGPPAVAANKMQRFAELFVRTLPYQGDTIAPIATANNGSA